MNLKQLESFVTVVECRSFTRAAKKLFITQPAVSFQLKGLEEQLGIRLLDRVDQEVVPTDGGLILYEQARNILGAYHAVLDGIDKLKNLESGTLRVGASTIPGEYILPYYLGDFSKVFPSVELGLKIGSSRQVIDWLKERVIDVGVVGAYVNLPGIKPVPFLVDELVLVAATGSIQVQEKSIFIERLPDYKMVLREEGSGTRAVMEKILAGHGVELNKLNVVMELGTTMAVLTAVAADLGLSFVSKWAAVDLIQANKLQQIDLAGVDLKRQLYLVVNEQHYLSVLANKFIEFILTKPAIFGFQAAGNI